MSLQHSFGPHALVDISFYLNSNLTYSGGKNASEMPYEVVRCTTKRVYVSATLTYDFLNLRFSKEYSA